MDNVIRETIDLPRGKRLRVVGRAGGETLNVDVYDANDYVVLTEPTREQARALRDVSAVTGCVAWGGTDPVTLYRLLELYCDGDDGDCPAQPDMSRSYQSATMLWNRAKSLGWVRRRAAGRLIHLCDECAAELCVDQPEKD